MNPNPPVRAVSFTTPQEQAAVVVALEFLAKFLVGDGETQIAGFCLGLRNRAAELLGMHLSLHVRDLRNMRMHDPACEMGVKARWISQLGVKEED